MKRRAEKDDKGKHSDERGRSPLPMVQVTTAASESWAMAVAGHMLVAAIVATSSWSLRSGDPARDIANVGILAGIAVGLIFNWLGPPLGLPLRIGFLPRPTHLPSPRAYREALRRFGRKWTWLGALFPILLLGLAQILPGPRPLSIPRNSLSDYITLPLGLGALETLAVYVGGWGWQFLAISRTKRVRDEC